MFRLSHTMGRTGKQERSQLGEHVPYTPMLTTRMHTRAHTHTHFEQPLVHPLAVFWAGCERALGSNPFLPSYFM